MISKNLKIFEIDGRKYQFNNDVFRLVFAQKASTGKHGIGEYEQLLADSLFVSRDAVHNWRQKLNGPSDVDKIKKIAEFLRCDMMLLMTDVTEENTDGEKDGEKDMNNTEKITLNDRQRDAVKRVYLAMLDYIYEFRGSLFEYDKNGDPYDTGYLLMEKFDEDILSVIQKEFIDIPCELWQNLLLYSLQNLKRLTYFDAYMDEEFSQAKQKFDKSRQEESMHLPYGMDDFLDDKVSDLIFGIQLIIFPYL